METFDVRLKTPFTLILAGASGCGKTTWLERLLKEFKTVTDGASKYQTLLWFSGTKQPALFQRVRATFAGTVRFFDSIDKEVYEQVEKQGRNSTIVIDDLMQETSGMAGVGKLFTKGRSHLNCNIILLWQNVFPSGSEARNLSINAHHMVLFKNPRDKSQVRYFATSLQKNSSCLSLLVCMYESWHGKMFSHFKVWLVTFDENPTTF